MKKKVMLVFGTRPEAIKMCPLVNELKKREELQTIVCVTGQHRQMLDMVLEAFDVTPDYDLSIMKDKQTLFDVTTNILNSIKAVLEKEKPDVVLVHGDTSTTFVTALACFYMQIPVGHEHSDVKAVYPIHMNPVVREIANEYLGDDDRSQEAGRPERRAEKVYTERGGRILRGADQTERCEGHG